MKISLRSINICDRIQRMKKYSFKSKNVSKKNAEFIDRLNPELKLHAAKKLILREAILYGQKICPELILEEYRVTAEHSGLNTSDVYNWMIMDSTTLKFEKELTFAYQKEISRTKRALYAATFQNHEGEMSLFRYKNNEYNFTAIGESLFSLRCGVNEKGLFAARHRIYSGSEEAGITPGMVIRLLLQRCSSADSAISFLKSIPHSTCSSYFIGHKNNMFIVETVPKLVKIIAPEKYFLTLANHFLSEELVNLDIKNSLFPQNNSIRRDSHAAFFLMKNRHKLDIELAKTILNNREGDISSAEGDFTTRYAMIYEENSRSFLLAEDSKGKRKYKKIKIG